MLAAMLIASAEELKVGMKATDWQLEDLIWKLVLVHAHCVEYIREVQHHLVDLLQ